MQCQHYADRGYVIVSFMALHYQCCDTTDDPTLAKQDQILAAVLALATDQEVAQLAHQAKQDEILSEVTKLTKPTMG